MCIPKSDLAPCSCRRPTYAAFGGMANEWPVSLVSATSLYPRATSSCVTATGGSGCPPPPLRSLSALTVAISARAAIAPCTILGSDLISEAARRSGRPKNSVASTPQNAAPAASPTKFQSTAIT